MESVPAPAHRDELADDYSDVASVHSQRGTKPRRKHQRGGRKESYDEPTPEETAGLLGPEDNPKPKNDNYEEDEDDGDDTCQYCSRKPRQPTPRREKPQPRRRTIPEPFETGIRAFNVRKAAGGKRPVGVRTTSEKKRHSPVETKPAAKRTSTSMSEDAGYETQSHESSSKAEEEEQESGKEEEAAAGKPMSIRLDLDLMIEVFLKAKIKGAVTVTFLE